MRPAHIVALTVTALFVVASRPAFVQTPDRVRLLNVTSRLDNAGGETVLIETSGPVAYAAAQPDPLTVVVDLRDVDVRGAASRVVTTPGGAAGLIEIDEIVGDLGPAARVQVNLTWPVSHRVRSSRGTIRIELDAPDRLAPGVAAPGPLQVPASATQAVPPVAAPVPTTGPMAPNPVATRIQEIETARTADGMWITLRGNGRLVPGHVGEAGGWPPRLVLDFPDVVSSVPTDLVVGQGPIDRIRTTPADADAGTTRVVIDLSQPAEYRVVPPDDDERDLRVMVRDAVPVPMPVTTPARPAAPASSAGAAPSSRPVNLIVLDPIAALDAPDGVASQQSTSARPAGAQVQGPSTVAAPTAISAVVELSGPPPTSSLAQPGPAAPVAAVPAPSAQPVPSPVPVPAPQVPMPAPAAPAPPSPPPAPPAAPQVPTQPVPPPAAPQPATSADRQYTGHPVTLDFQQADLRAVLRTFSEISGLNMVIDPTVQGTVDVALRDVPWDQALDIILRANKLGYTLDGTVVRIAPLTVLSDEEAQRRKLAEEQALSGELRVLTRTLSYARAAGLAQLVTRTALSQRGTVQVDDRTNTLIITDLQERLDTASQLIQTLDRPEPQVEIEARIIQTTREFARAIGVQWGLNGRVAPELGNTTGLAFPNTGSVSGRTGATQGGPTADPRASTLEASSTAVNLPAASASSAIGIALGAVNGAFNIDVALSALERTGKGRVLSTPRVSTQNNVEAEVTQGIQIPIQTVANNTVTVTFKDAALTLRVTPQITSASTVIMRIVLENASPDFSRSVNGIPPIDTQRANTQVQVNDGATTVIGGIFVSREQSSQERTPFFHRIPLLGWLFKRDSISDENRELLIFITPRIIRS